MAGIVTGTESSRLIQFTPLLCRPRPDMPPRKKIAKKKRRKKKPTPRVQVPRVCGPALSRLLAQGQHELQQEQLRLTLGEAVKRLWQVAKAKGLQQGRTIRCDAAMQRLFGVAELDMFEVAGALSTHMTGAGSAGAASSTAATAAVTTSSAAGASAAGAAPPSASGEREGMLITLSPALTSILCGSEDGRGGGSRELMISPKEALRLLGKYISRRGLRDATDRRRIHCDAALSEIVGKGSFTIFEARALIEQFSTPVPVGGGGSGSGGSGNGAHSAAGRTGRGDGVRSNSGGGQDGDGDGAGGSDDDDDDGYYCVWCMWSHAFTGTASRWDG